MFQNNELKMVHIHVQSHSVVKSAKHSNNNIVSNIIDLCVKKTHPNITSATATI